MKIDLPTVPTVFLPGQVVDPYSFADKASGELLCGFTLSYLGGTQSMQVDAADYSKFSDGDAVVVKAAPLIKKGVLKLGSPKVIQLNGEPFGVAKPVTYQPAPK